MVPLEVFGLDLSARALRVLGALIAHANAEGCCWPSDGTIAEITKIRQDNLHFLYRELEGMGLIAREGNNRKRVIRLALPSSTTVNLHGGGDQLPSPTTAIGGKARRIPSPTTVLGRANPGIPSPTTVIASDGIQIPSSTTVIPPNTVAHDGNNTVAHDGIAPSPTTSNTVAHDGSIPSPTTVPIRTDQEQTKEEIASNAPARGHAHAREQAAGLAAAPKGPVQDSRDPGPAELAWTTPFLPAVPPPTEGIAGKITHLGGEYLDGTRAVVPTPVVDPVILREIQRDIQRDDPTPAFWCERLLAMGCPSDWLPPLFRSFWCRRGSKLPRTFTPLELRFKDWRRAGNPVREQLAEADLKALEKRELEAADARQWAEYERSKAESAGRRLRP